MTYGNEPTRAPDLQEKGRAWRIALPPSIRDEQVLAACGQWLVHAPHGHPHWPWYAVQGISLKEIPGARPPFIQFPGATHELLVVALNPEGPLPDVDAWCEPGTPPMRFLEPVDQCVQFIVADDHQASELVEQCVKVIVAGMSPDQDYRGWWREAIAQTAEHLRLGGHPGG